MIPAEEAGRGTYLKVYDRIGEAVYCIADDEPRIDAAVSRWIETKRDTLLDLTLLEGTTYKTLASDIMAWTITTPETREYRVALNKANEDEHTEHRHAAGDWEAE